MINLSKANWDEVRFIGIDNSDPPQLWAWANEPNEGAEPLFRIDGALLAGFIREMVKDTVRVKWWANACQEAWEFRDINAERAKWLSDELIKERGYI